MGKKFLLIILFLFIGNYVFLQKDSKEKLIQKKKSLEKEIELANQLLEDTRGKKKNSLNELKLLKVKIEKRSNYILNLNSEVDKIDKEITKSNILIANYQKELERVKKEYSDLIFFAFKNQSTEFNFMYLLAANDLNKFYARVKYLQQYKDYRKEQGKLIIALKRTIERKVDELTKKREIEKKLMNRLTYEKASLVKDSEETDIVVKELKKQESDLLKDIEDKKKIYKKLDNEIAELIKAEAKKTNFKELNSDLKIIAKNFEDNRGRLPWPTSQGVVVNKFGDHPHPVIKGVNVNNSGIDISTSNHAIIRCIYKGKVSKIFNIKGANNTVIIQHGNYFTVYHNLVNISVKSGQMLNMNESIGEVYTDPKSGESIVHFEIWKELEKQDPETWLSN